MSAQELLTEIQKLPPAEQQRLLEALKRDVKMKSEQRESSMANQGNGPWRDSGAPSPEGLDLKGWR